MGRILGKKTSFDELTSNAILIAIVSGPIAALIATIGVALFYDRMYQEIPWKLIFITLSMIPMYLFALNMRSMLNADYDIPRSVLVRLSRPAILCISLSTVVLLGTVTLENAVKCAFLGVAGMLIVSIVMVYRSGFRLFKVDKALLKPMTLFGLKTHLGQLLTYLEYRFDIFLVAYFLTPREVGIYSIALTLGEVLWRIPNVANKVLLSRLAKEGDRRSATLTARLNSLIFAFTAACMMPIFFLTKWIILVLFGEEFLDAWPVVIVLLPGVLAISISKTLTPNLIMQGRAWTYSLSIFCAVVVMIILDVFLIPAYGILGAGIGASVAYIVSSSIVLVVVVWNNEIPLRSYFDFIAEIKPFLRARGDAA